MTRYHTWDQEERLGPPPWDPLDPKLADWERAHGHDARTKCYAEYGCMLVEPDAFERGKRTAMEIVNRSLDELEVLGFTPDGEWRRAIQEWVERAEDEG